MVNQLVRIEREILEEETIKKVLDILFSAKLKPNSKKSFRLEVEDRIRKEFVFTKHKCKKCKEWKKKSEFTQDKGTRRGIRLICEWCDKERRQNRYWSNPEKYRERKKVIYNENKQKQINTS